MGDTKTTYTVWVGGVPCVENADLFTAMTTAFEWFEEGYDDVQIEKLQETLDEVRVEGMLAKLEERKFYAEGRE
jgi:hypothetical protein